MSVCFVFKSSTTCLKVPFKPGNSSQELAKDTHARDTHGTLKEKLYYGFYKQLYQLVSAMQGTFSFHTESGVDENITFCFKADLLPQPSACISIHIVPFSFSSLLFYLYSFILLFFFTFYVFLNGGWT